MTNLRTTGVGLPIQNYSTGLRRQFQIHYESMVSLVSRRYMRVVNGSLLVCLSEYLPLHTV